MQLIRALQITRRWFVAAGAAAFVIGGMACGGGGGGGNPAAPPAPPPPPPPSGSSCSANSQVQISVTGFNNASNSFAGSEVEIVGSATSTVDSNNQVCFDDVPGGVQRAEFTGSGHLTRRVRLNIMPGMINQFDVDLVEPGPFDVDAFDEIYRSFSVDGTVRWKTPPTRVMLDSDSLSSLDQGLDFFESNVRRSFNTWLSGNTGGFFGSTPVTVGSIGPIDPDDFSCNDVPPGEIHIVGIDECPIDENFIILGSATHCFDTVGNEVVLAAIFFNPCSTVATIEHEIIHTLCAGHLESRPNESIMGSPGGSEEILPLDRRHMQYLYSRPAGTETPDDAWGLTPLEPMTMASGTQLGSVAGDLFLPRAPEGGHEPVLEPARVAPRPPAEREASKARPER